MTDRTGITHPPLSPLVWTIAAFLIAAAPHLAAMPAALAGIVILLSMWRITSGWFQWSPIPGWLRILITLALIVLVVMAYGGLWGRRFATGLLCVMLAAKSMEMYQARDLRMVASVCFFLIATQFLFNESLPYLVYLAGGCWAATIALIQIQQIPAMQRAHSGAGMQIQRRSLNQAATLLALALPVALALFVLFPRLAQPLWGLPDEMLDGRTGLSDSMSPGAISELFLDDSPAFRAEFDDQPPPYHQRYWRGPVLWRFDGSTWRTTQFANARGRQSVPITESSLHYRIQLEPHERRWLLGLDYPARSSMPESTITVDHQLLSRHPVTTLSQYEVISTPDFVPDAELTQSERLLATYLPPESNPRTRALAGEMRARHPEDRDLIEAILQMFHDEFSYSLSTAPLGRHGADEFLFDLKDGYCEYYASAFAVLMRAVGIPTRVVTGYQGGFWSEAGGYLLVRQSDAHAWNEVWLEGTGWVRVDPTAAVSPLRISQGSRSVIERERALFEFDWMFELRNRYDRVQHLWNQWVLGFDAERQRWMLERLGLPRLGATGIGLLMIATVILIAIPIALWLLREQHRTARSEAEKAWLRLLRHLRRRRFRKRAAETPLEFALRIEPELGSTGAGLVQLALNYNRVHYGPEDPELTRKFIANATAWRSTGTRAKSGNPMT